MSNIALPCEQGLSITHTANSLALGSELDTTLSGTSLLKMNSQQQKQVLAQCSLAKSYQLIAPLSVKQRKVLRAAISEDIYADLTIALSQTEPVIAVMSGGYSMPLVDGMVVGDVLALLQTQNYTHSSCFLTDSDGQYLGVLELARLAGEDHSSSIASLMQRVPAYHVSLDQEQAVTLLSQSSIDCLPLIDSYGRPVGFFNSQQAISVMQREQTEDVEKMMGIQADALGGTYLETSVFSHISKRIYWILGLAVVGITSGMVIQSYDDAIMALTILALYMPMVADTGGNSGSQAATVIVRALALGELKLSQWLHVLWKELRISLFIGACLGLLTASKVYLLSYGIELPENLTFSLVAFAIGLALFLQVISATVIGAALPLMAQVLKQDPAVVASPAITTLVDITGLLIYFYVTTSILLS
ncbi:magnesium transporter [Shewanella sp. Scap07]|uniref:magnesium transporter n=1 Tax=Shewanella sp. Scap07 TaxID=2589987 RepID=UPI0015BA8B4A|nr:magnesium transporter [Shewanella sp. Scap07]QLE85136.1 magnesium transporter [Shewanella sp. Scap07]